MSVLTKFHMEVNPESLDSLKGFTLIELMICIAIISILASIIVPFISSSIKDNYEIVEAVKPNKNPQLPMEVDRYTHDNKY